jgi:hypothetical protein
MSTDPPYVGPEMMGPLAPKKRMGAATKVLIVLVLLFLLMVFFCCGGLVATGVWLTKAQSEDPQVIRQNTREMIQLDVPPVLEPAVAFKLKIPFSSQTLITLVAYAHKASHSALILASFGDMFAEQDQGKLRKLIDEKLRKEGIGGEENVDQWEGREREITVRDEPVTFHFAAGKDTRTGAQRLDVTGTLKGDTGPVLLILSTDTETLDEATIVEMLESIE